MTLLAQTVYLASTGPEFRRALQANPDAATTAHGLALGDEELEEFGYNLGVLRQLADDLDDLWNGGDHSDLALGKRTLPVVYALAVAGPSEGECLEALLERAAAGDGGAEAVARQRITALGGPLYLVAQAQLCRGRADAALRELGGPRVVRAQLHGLLDRAMPALAVENHG